MSWKAIAGSILFVLILLAGSNFINWKLTSKAYYKDGQNSVVVDSTRTDTVKVLVPYPDPFPVYIKREIEAETDTTDGIITHFAETDTTVMIEEDTLAVITQGISFTEGVFKTLMEIDIRPVERLIAITRTTFRTVPVFTPADPPFYNTWVAGFISACVVVIGILVLLL